MRNYIDRGIYSIRKIKIDSDGKHFTDLKNQFALVRNEIRKMTELKNESYLKYYCSWVEVINFKNKNVSLFQKNSFKKKSKNPENNENYEKLDFLDDEKILINNKVYKFSEIKKLKIYIKTEPIKKTFSDLEESKSILNKFLDFSISFINNPINSELTSQKLVLTQDRKIKIYDFDNSAMNLDLNLSRKNSELSYSSQSTINSYVEIYSSSKLDKESKLTGTPNFCSLALILLEIFKYRNISPKISHIVQDGNLLTIEEYFSLLSEVYLQIYSNLAEEVQIKFSDNSFRKYFAKVLKGKLLIYKTKIDTKASFYYNLKECIINIATEDQVEIQHDLLENIIIKLPFSTNSEVTLISMLKLSMYL